MITKPLSFNSCDQLSCRLISAGNRVYSFDLTGVSTMSDIYHFILREIGQPKGLLNLNLRNKTQGQSYNLSLKFSDAA
ncbi:MAG: hypothetical protein J1E99_02305 [Muribaculaceae bacterium]|nr:hypothetical protein [Muribaculaceae bacterium]